MSGPRRADHGQATAELALVLPVLCTLLLLVVQVGLVVRADLLVVAAAREGARAAALDPDPGAAVEAARAATTLDPRRLQVQVGRRGPPGGLVQVVVTFDDPTDVPIVGALVPDVTLRAEASMRVEADAEEPGG